MSHALRIAIVGDGVGAAMAGAALAVELGLPRFQLTIVPAGNGGDHQAYGPVVAGDPSLRRFHSRLGLADEALVQAAGASFTLGTAFAGWSRQRPAYFSPYGDIGAAIDGVPFHQLIARLRSEGGDARIGDYSIATLLAQAGRFGHPSNDPASPLSTFSYGFHVQRQAYSKLLIELARRNGAGVTDSWLKRVEVGDGGAIERLILATGEQLPVDLVIDASADGEAISAVDAEWESWSHLFPCDRTAHAARTDSTPPAPYSLVEAHRLHWVGTVPTQGAVGETVAYSSALLDETRAERILRSRGSALGEIRHAALLPGRRKTPWSSNCIAVGAAACVLEPLSGFETMLITSSIERLLRMFPSSRNADVEAREYNRETCDELERTRDFLLLRYLINGRVGEEFWDAARGVTASPELERKLALYRSRGAVPMVDGDSFDEAEWALLFDEHGVRPARYDVLADAMPADRLVRLLDRMREQLTAAAASQPLHGEYLAKLRRKAAA